MSLVERCDDCGEFQPRCLCGLTLEEAKTKRTRPIIPSRQAQLASFIKHRPTRWP